MKHRSIIFLIIIQILPILYIFFVIRDAGNLNIKTIKALPSLYVDDNRIKRADNDREIQLKGVSSSMFACQNNPINKRELILEEIKSWNINILGLFIIPDCLTDKVNELDWVVKWAENNQVYIYFMPVPDINQDIQAQLKQFPSLITLLAKRYRNKHHIIYGFWAEPNKIKWKDWLDFASSMAKMVTRERESTLLLMSGIGFGREVDLENPLPYKNVIYDFHDYPADNSEQLKSLLMKDEINFIWNDTMEKYPIMIGEFGGVWQPPFSTEEDLSYVQIVLDRANLNHLNYTAYTIDDHHDDEIANLSLIDWKTGNPTKRGELIKNDLLNHPPTNFNEYE